MTPHSYCRILSPFRLSRMLVTAFLLCSGYISTFAAPLPPIDTPRVRSVVPEKGIPGDTIRFYGSGFNTTRDSNIVFFGATLAKVYSATSDSVKVVLPVGALHAPATILNTRTHLTGHEAKSFNPYFDGACMFADSINLKSRLSLNAGGATYSASVADIDTDGKADVVTVKFNSSGFDTLMVFRNTSSGPGNISFAAPVITRTGRGIADVKTGDFDRDGRLDFAVAMSGSAQMSVIRNVSTAGSIAFAYAAIAFATSASGTPTQLCVADFDGDGKPDIGAALGLSDASNDTQIVIYRNRIATIPVGSGPFIASSFSPSGGEIPKRLRMISTNGGYTLSIAATDLDLDGKPDIVVTGALEGHVLAYRNLSTPGPGGLNFSGYTRISVGDNPFYVQAGDLNGDDKPDLVVTDRFSNKVSIIQNNSTSGSLSFGSPVVFTGVDGANGVAVGDLTGDGKVDIAITNYTTNTLTFFANRSTGGTITASSFRRSAPVASNASPLGVNFGDFDGDKKLDVLVAHENTTAAIAVYRNYPIPFIDTIRGNRYVCRVTPVTFTDTASGGTWSLTNTTVANIGALTGVLTPLSNGIDTIIYTIICQGDTSITMKPIQVGLYPVLGTITGTTSICHNDSTLLSNSYAGGVWRSSNIGVATIDSVTGRVRPGITASGTTTITYSATNLCGRADSTRILTVNPSPGAIAGPSAVCYGDSVRLNSSPTGGTWTTSDASVATVNSSTRYVTGMARAGGSCVIRYTLTGGCYSTANMTVNPLPAVGTITGPRGACVGTSIGFSCSTLGGTWSVSNPSIATIDATTGVLTGSGSGGSLNVLYTVRNSCGDSTVRYAINVYPNPTSIGGTTTVCEGSTTTLTNGTSGGVWTSATGTTAAVGFSSGIVSGLRAGTEVITYTIPSGGCYTTTTVTVNPRPAFISGTGNVCIGNYATFTNSLGGGSWYSTNTSVATIDISTGMLFALSGGTTTVSYSVAGCSTTRTVTIDTLPNPILL
ncbi:MAG: hypothetical protein EBX41_04345 [Chitinophagia bacterium]|nr:hypothetical protein [Chitinophagia bacterium]